MAQLTHSLQDNGVPEVKIQWVYREFLPNAIRIMMARKQDIEERDIQPLMTFLNRVVEVLTHRVGSDEVSP